MEVDPPDYDHPLLHASHHPLLGVRVGGVLLVPEVVRLDQVDAQPLLVVHLVQVGREQVRADPAGGDRVGRAGRQLGAEEAERGDVHVDSPVPGDIPLELGHPLAQLPHLLVLRGVALGGPDSAPRGPDPLHRLAPALVLLEDLELEELDALDGHVDHHPAAHAVGAPEVLGVEEQAHHGRGVERHHAEPGPEAPDWDAIVGTMPGQGDA